MNYYLPKLSKSELRLAILKFVVVNLLFAIFISNTHLLNLLPSKIFPAQSCGGNSETSSSCGMACCVGKSEPGSCCKPKSNQTNSLESSSCHSENEEETDEAIFLQINVSFFADYYLAKEKDTLTKEYLKSQAKPKLSAAFSSPCPCDTQNIATQFRFNPALIILIGNLQPRPPTISNKFNFFYPSKDSSYSYKTDPSRAPPSIS